MLHVIHAGPRIDVGPGKRMRGDQEARSASVLYLSIHFPLFFICNHKLFVNSSRTPDVRCPSVIKTKVRVITRERFGIFCLPKKPIRCKLLPTPTSFPDMVGSGMGDEVMSMDAESWECALKHLT